MLGRDLFSANLPREFFAGRPTSAPVAQVRDVIMCAAPDDVSTHEFAAHPPIAGAYEAREQIGTPGSVEVGRRVRIDRLSADDAKLLVNACIPRGHYFKPIRHDNQRYSLMRDVDPEEAAWHPFGWDEDRALWDALTLSRLVRDNNYSTEFAARITDYADGEQTVMYAVTGESKHVYRLRQDREWLDAAEGRELAALLSAYWRAPPALDSRVGRALWRAEWASWLMFGDLALSILVSGLEALLKTQESAGATRQFKHRVTALSSELGIEGVDDDFCRNAYVARSEWVHGTHVRLFSAGSERAGHEGAGIAEGPVDDDERRFLAQVALVQDVLRAAVRRCIEDPEFRRIFDADRAIRARWPVPSD
ncbi:MAG: hypothetical protein JO262_08535 [Solirubrobacterales bacterium]|nr:hypothetical protein [Solirubrobacterales bacterium]